jgi:hypothetical protein
LEGIVKKKSLSESMVKRVLGLIKETDLNLREIGRQARCSLAIVKKINKENGAIRKPRALVAKPKAIQKKFIVRDVQGGFL